MRVLPSIAVLLTAAALVPALPASASASTPATGMPVKDEVTLITGDRVTLFDGGAVTVAEGPGRSRVTFQLTREDGHLYVVPSDQRGGITSGRLDKRLFDVTSLTEFGYRSRTPVLVQNGRSTTGAADGAVALRSAAPRAKIWLDGKRRISLDRSVAQIGAPAAWAAGYTGAGVTVAVLDTGVDDTHADLRGRIAGTRNFTADPSTDDTVGHGTHVAATIASHDLRYRGVAPDARLLIGKVCEGRYCTDSAILAGIEWAGDSGARIVNMSLGGGPTPGIDPLEEAINRISAEKGTLFVTAAGNEGPGESTLGSPGTAEAALSVAAVDREDRTAPFSSRGPDPTGAVLKPEISAPGVEIAAAKAAHGYLGTPVDDTHVAMSGTSMATPHVAGAAALLAQQHPGLSGGKLKALLMGSAAAPVGGSVLEQGAGRVDLTRAIGQTVTASPAGVSFGTQSWPHDDDKPIERTVTYANPGAEAVTLDLSFDVNAPGVFRATPSQVTVAAGATTTVGVAADTSGQGDAYGRVQGALVATAGSTVVRTPLDVLYEDAKFDLGGTVRDSAGNPIGGYLGLYRTDAPGSQDWIRINDDGTFRTRIDGGQYGAVAQVDNEAEAAYLAYPELTLDRDRTIEIDGRRSSVVDLRPAGAAGLTEQFGTARMVHKGPQGHGLDLVIGASGGFGGLGVPLRLGGEGPSLDIMSVWATPVSTADTQVYSLGWSFPIIPARLTRRVDPSRMALIDERLPATPAGDHVIVLSTMGSTRSVTDAGFGVQIDVPGATRIRRWVTTTRESVRWRSQFIHTGPDFLGKQFAYAPPVGYRPGTVQVSTPLAPVFGPSLTWIGDGNDLSRTGDVVRVPAQTGLLGDSAGNRVWSPASAVTTGMSRLDVPGEISPGPDGAFTLPAERGRYRLERQADGVDASWDFRSARTGATTPLPLSVPRFTPELDAAGAAPGGQAYAVPVTVQSYPRSGAGKPSALTAQVSFDDGATWASVPVRDGRILVDHPAGPGHVSLRGTVTDSRGNTGSVTIIRAYALQDPASAGPAHHQPAGAG
ncbi:S8 family serine peptidase [Actinoplanes sp. NPDC089786]|uniref:S8 family peptidase n=1 Tax=Actinoplanes sp. NPDC089786 TaxID=3155185 RepID=UPI00342CCDDE